MIYLTSLRPNFLEKMEARAYDIRFAVRKEQRGTPEVVLIEMDDKSIEKLGRWPWPRTDWAQFFRNLSKYDPKVVAVDVSFSEPDQNVNLNFLKELKTKYLQEAKQFKKEQNAQEEAAKSPDIFLPYLEQLEKEAGTDQILADALGETKNVILGWFYYLYEDEGKQVGAEENAKRMNLIKPFAIKVVKYLNGAGPSVLDNPAKVPNIQGFQVNLPMFTEKLAGSGYFTFLPDGIDDIFRHGNLVAGWPPADQLKNPEDYVIFPSLSLEALRVYLGSDPQVIADELGIREIRIGTYRIPVDERGMILINYQGGLDSFIRYSFADIYNDFAETRKESGFDPVKTFKNKIVLVGPTALGIYDLRTTPFGSLPGVLLHANIIDNVLNNRALYRPSWMWGFDMIAIALLGLLLSLIYPRVKPIFSGSLIMILVAGYLLINYYIFNTYHISLTITYPIESVMIVYLGITLYHYTMEEREKRFIRNTFSYYLSPDVINDLLTNPDKLKLGGENKRVTIFFSDIAGFTSISEKLPTERLVPLLNEYLTEMSDIVLKNRGTVDKYIGDAVMAIFGAPMDYPDHAASAVLSALEMHERLLELNKKWKEQGLPPVNCRVGLNTGEVKVGNMGSLKRMDYTVIGDEVNLASRLEGANKAYGTRLMLSESTFNDAKDAIEARELDLLAVVGKQKPVRVYQALARKGQLDPKMMELVKLFHQGLVLYRDAKFPEALELFNQCLKIDPSDSPSQVYAQRAQTYIETPPPPDWDGVWRLTKK